MTLQEPEEKMSGRRGHEGGESRQGSKGMKSPRGCDGERSHLVARCRTAKVSLQAGPGCGATPTRCLWVPERG